MILYDGVNNSVFESQVALPLRKRVEQGLYSEALIISFENDPVQAQHHQKRLAPLKLICFPKHMFWGTWSLWASISRLTNFFAHCKQPYDVIARGPLAGFITLMARDLKAENIIIQARGLLAEEYRYTHKNARGLSRLVHRLRAHLFHRLEHTVFSVNWLSHYPQLSFEAVSPELKKYLTTSYTLAESAVKIASFDLPVLLDRDQKMAWKNEVRSELGISLDALVWCYAGSAKAWQCPQQTIVYFLQAAEKVKPIPAWLLILTTDTANFLSLLNELDLNNNPHIVLKHVPHAEIYRYLSACDEGIIMREPHLLNWISRPTKALEYQAVDLKIAHNNTIGFLTNSSI
jgi:hypothetical protein